MMEKENNPINDKEASINESLQQEKNIPKEEEVSEEKETMESLEARMLDIEALVGQLDDFENLPPEEMEFVAESIKQSSEGENAIQRLQKATENVLLASHHLSGDLSGKFDSRLVKAVGLVGKLTGGIGGALTAGPVASVAGSKAGEYFALKSLQSVGHRLPESFRKKVEKPEDLEKIEANETLIERELEELESSDVELEKVALEIDALTGTEKEQFLENLENDADAQTNVERVKNAYNHIGEFYERMETQHPVLGTVTEVALHSLLGPLLGVAGLGEGAIHIIEAVGGTAVEKANLHILGALQSTKDVIVSTKGIGRRFFGRKKDDTL